MVPRDTPVTLVLRARGARRNPTSRTRAGDYYTLRRARAFSCGMVAARRGGPWCENRPLDNQGGAARSTFIVRGAPPGHGQLLKKVRLPRLHGSCANSVQPVGS